jgi:hypothetical protein
MSSIQGTLLVHKQAGDEACPADEHHNGANDYYDSDAD